MQDTCHLDLDCLVPTYQVLIESKQSLPSSVVVLYLSLAPILSLHFIAFSRVKYATMNVL
ncbi:hypothetical protein I7I53_01973 [Histoplasma capsulatum var. duboisii H88]|uniref:Uncharacterized protein n=1 Tax=Ajellomyces capsulatus (strain H88) TaxID=544711 RepID=A0A8A1LPA5_AJEC8|nr:hypothetical protein I7I53_01973 [Histoplasma capsulatum var. duboisii H88]